VRFRLDPILVCLLTFSVHKGGGAVVYIIRAFLAFRDGFEGMHGIDCELWLDKLSSMDNTYDH